MRQPPDQSADHRRPSRRPATGFETRQRHFKDTENLVILAFSGGGTRAAAFSYGVLEFLRRTEIIGPKGGKVRLLDAGRRHYRRSGGSFTALAYGLYGEKLFDDYEQRFLKRDVQGEFIARTFNPTYWGALWSTGWGRSELAAAAVRRDPVQRRDVRRSRPRQRPFIIASATDISTGARLRLRPDSFDILCSDLGAVPLSRAAAASSAVPVVLSPVTLNNYGGTCNFAIPAWLKPFPIPRKSARPAARAMRILRTVHGLRGWRPSTLSSISSTAACRTTSACAACSTRWRPSKRCTRRSMPTPLDSVRRIIVFIVNSLSSPTTKWDQSETPPGTVDILLRATGMPIDAYSYEAIELLKDTAARWQTMRLMRARPRLPATTTQRWPRAARAGRRDLCHRRVVPCAEDKAELEYLNEQPTTFVLPGEAVDRLRAAAGTIILASPEFNRLLKDVGATIVPKPPAAGSAAPAASGAATPSPAAE